MNAIERFSPILGTKACMFAIGNTKLDMGRGAYDTTGVKKPGAPPPPPK